MSRKQPYAGPRQTLSHPQLGDLTGRVITSKHFPQSPVVQYRSIPYATVPKRFMPSVPLTDIPSSFDERPHRDFTQFGAACPQTAATNPAWFDAYGGPLEDDLDISFDEFTCLTLTVSGHESHLNAAKTAGTKLPVMVYVHGGGAQEGVGHVDGLHSNATLTSYANSISQPVLTVNIGYRLHWLGNLTCQDVLSEFESAPTSSYGPFNLNMQDQRHAFAWIRRYIGGFGGDVSNITVFGESAGSVLLTYHICGSTVRLFDRAILQSGLIFGDLPFEVKEAEYQAMLKHFGIQGATATERLAALRQVDVVELALFQGSHMTPYIGPVAGVKAEDSLFSRGIPSAHCQMDLIANCKWLQGLIFGDDFWEGVVLAPVLKGCSQASFVESITSVFPEEEANALLAAYEISPSEKMDANRLWMQLSLFYGDLLFSAPYQQLSNTLLADKAGRGYTAYRYSFGLSNPFIGSPINFMVGHHFVEILYLFLTLLDRYPTHRDNWAARQAQATARQWIMFAHGEDPWDPHAISSQGTITDAKIAVCDDLRGWTVRSLKEDNEVGKSDPWGPRRYAGWEAIRNAFNAIRSNEDDEISYSRKFNTTRLKILKIAYGPLGVIQLPELEVAE